VVAQQKIAAEDQIKTRGKRTKKAVVAERGAAQIDYHFQKKVSRTQMHRHRVRNKKKTMNIYLLIFKNIL
jgi:hypothetical protein